MKSNRSFALLRLAMGSLLSICFGAQLANAQATAAGKFTMPFEARWGEATLPAGDYTFKLDKLGGGAIVRVYRAQKGVAFITNVGYDLESSGGTALIVIRNSTGNTVSDLRLPEIGLVLHYAPHKSSPADAEREIAQIVPVKTTVK
jgi:hypothetical protein